MSRSGNQENAEPAKKSVNFHNKNSPKNRRVSFSAHNPVHVYNKGGRVSDVHNLKKISKSTPAQKKRRHTLDSSTPTSPQDSPPSKPPPKKPTQQVRLSLPAAPKTGGTLNKNNKRRRESYTMSDLGNIPETEGSREETMDYTGAYHQIMQQHAGTRTTDTQDYTGIYKQQFEGRGSDEDDQTDMDMTGHLSNPIFDSHPTHRENRHDKQDTEDITIKWTTDIPFVFPIVGDQSESQSQISDDEDDMELTKPLVSNIQITTKPNPKSTPSIQISHPPAKIQKNVEFNLHNDDDDGMDLTGTFPSVITLITPSTSSYHEANLEFSSSLPNIQAFRRRSDGPRQFGRTRTSIGGRPSLPSTPKKENLDVQMGQDQDQDQEDDDDGMEETRVIPTIFHTLSNNDQDEASNEDDFQKALEGIFSYDEAPNNVDPASYQDQMNLLKEVSVLETSNLPTTPLYKQSSLSQFHRPKEQDQNTQKRNVDPGFTFRQFLTSSDLLRSYQGLGKEPTASTMKKKLPQTKTFTPSKEDYFRTQCYVKSEVASLQSACQLLQKQISDLSEITKGQEVGFEENPPLLFQKFQKGSSEVYQYRVKKLWEQCSKDVKAETEKARLDAELEKKQRLQTALTKVQSHVNQSQRLCSELKETRKALSKDRELFTERHRSQQLNFSTNTSFDTSSQVDSATESHIFSLLSSYVAWTPTRLSHDEIILSFQDLVSLHIKMNPRKDGFHIADLNLQPTKQDPETKSFFQIFFSDLELDSLIGSLLTVPTITKLLASLSARACGLQSLRKEIGILKFRFNSVNVEGEDNSTLVNVTFSNHETRKRFQVGIRIPHQYPCNGIELASLKSMIGSVNQDGIKKRVEQTNTKEAFIPLVSLCQHLAISLVA